MTLLDKDTIITPVDLQVNGYEGIDFSSVQLTKKIFIDCCHSILRSGTSAFLPTLVSSSRHVYDRNLPIIAEVIQLDEFKGRVLGIHLEGPFISSEKGFSGAHREKYILPPDAIYLKKLQVLAAGNIRLLSIASELEDIDSVILCARELNISLSIGHSDMRLNDLKRCHKLGVSSITHFGNAVPSMIHRHNNYIMAILGAKNYTLMMITDGHHVSKDFFNTMYDIKGVNNIAIVSDSNPCAGLKPGKYFVLGQDVIINSGGEILNRDEGHLVGSSCTITDCLNVLLKYRNMSMNEIRQISFINPLSIIRMSPSSINPMSGVKFIHDQDRFSPVAAYSHPK